LIQLIELHRVCERRKRELLRWRRLHGWHARLLLLLVLQLLIKWRHASKRWLLAGWRLLRL
jgi:hypothetical protein